LLQQYMSDIGSRAHHQQLLQEMIWPCCAHCLHTHKRKLLRQPLQHWALERHLWYLSELLVGFAFFDDEVPVEEKRLMVLALKENEGSEEPSKRIPPFVDPTAKRLHDFVTTSTVRFFQILGLSEEFLQSDSSEWEHQETYKTSQKIAQSVKVINDLAERGVALIQEFNSALTRNEEQKQFCCK